MSDRQIEVTQRAQASEVEALRSAANSVMCEFDPRTRKYDDRSVPLVELEGVRREVVEAWTQQFRDNESVPLDWQWQSGSYNYELYTLKGSEDEAMEAIARRIDVLLALATAAKHRVLYFGYVAIQTLVDEKDHHDGWVYWNDQCFESCQHLRDWCLQNARTPPRVAIACDRESLRFDACELVRSELEALEADEDAFDRVSDEKLAELQAFLDVWADEAGVHWWRGGEKVGVRLDPALWTKTQEDHARSRAAVVQADGGEMPF